MTPKSAGLVALGILAGLTMAALIGDGARRKRVRRARSRVAVVRDRGNVLRLVPRLPEGPKVSRSDVTPGGFK